MTIISERSYIKNKYNRNNQLVNTKRKPNNRLNIVNHGLY